MSAESLAEQMERIRPHVSRNTGKPDDALQANLQTGEASIVTPGVTSKVELNLKDQREFIENSKALQRASIREKKMGSWVNFAVLVLTLVTAAGAGYAAYKGSKGTGGGR